MGKKVDYEKEIVGKKINRLTIKDIVRTKGKETKALCDCECGTTDIVVSIYRLTKGLTKSCGCLSKEMSSKQGKKNHKTNKYDCYNEFCVGYTSCGKEFFFDKDDYKKIKDYCWYVLNNKYIYGSLNGEKILLHRLIMGVSDSKLQVDHINHNGFDNRKSNLRVVTNSENSMNKNYQKNNDLKIKGIYRHSQHAGYCADIGINGKTIHLGCFKDINDAIKARKEAEEKYFGEYSYNNSMAMSNLIQ